MLLETNVKKFGERVWVRGGRFIRELVYIYVYMCVSKMGWVGRRFGRCCETRFGFIVFGEACAFSNELEV